MITNVSLAGLSIVISPRTRFWHIVRQLCKARNCDSGITDLSMCNFLY